MPVEIVKDAEVKMQSSIEHLLRELGKLRTGQASVALLDDLMVDYYGNPTPLKQVATLGAPDSQTSTVQPWETSILKDIRIWIDSETVNPALVLKEILRESGVEGKNIGVEYDSYGLTAKNWKMLDSALEGFCHLSDAF